MLEDRSVFGMIINIYGYQFLGVFYILLFFFFNIDIHSSEKKVMENNGDPSVKLIRELRAENERLRNSNENTNLLLLTDSYKVIYH